MFTFTLHQLVSAGFLTLLIIAVGYHILIAFSTGSISFGYKYYPPVRGFARKKSPAAFWAVIGIYIFSLSGCLSLVVFILKHPII